MEFKDYDATLGVEHMATQDDIKRAYRKLARKYPLRSAKRLAFMRTLQRLLAGKKV